MATIKIKKSLTLDDAFENFLLVKNSQGLTEATLTNYKSALHCLSKYMDTSIPISDLQKSDLQKVFTKMRSINLSTNTIASYVRILKVFLSWAKDEGYCSITLPSYRTEETVKETYTDKELTALLKKPNMKTCRFPKYRTWVIINFLVNSGARASTIRSILIDDVDLERGTVIYRHNKNRKVQTIPLCSQMITILKEYLHYRKGASSDYLFCTESGEMMTEHALRNAVVRYNTSRGVSKTSIHLFRHTFAKKYLIDCGGDAFTLQRILGHSTLDMTKH